MIILDDKGNDVSNNANELKKIGVLKCYVSKDVLDEIIWILKIKGNYNYEKLDKMDYYCVYVGLTKSKKGFAKRIVKQNINGNVKVSTLRKSLKAIFKIGKSKFKVNDVLDKKSIFVIIPISDINKVKQEKFNEINKKNFYRLLNLNQNNLYDYDRYLSKIREKISNWR